jgi:small neutral amino acid transporter SnatA (MarC family)
MALEKFLHAALLLFVLLNPFLLIVYLTDVVARLTPAKFAMAVVGAGAISVAVFCAFAVLGDYIFSKLILAQFASFQVFGGMVFLFIALQFVFHGPGSIELLRGDSKNISGSIAMPVLIGPGTLSASVVVGKRLSPLLASAAVLLAVSASVGMMIALKCLHDYVRARNSKLVERYTDVAGRILALYAGTISIEMIFTGVTSWQPM